MDGERTSLSVAICEKDMAWMMRIPGCRYLSKYDKEKLLENLLG